MCGIVFMCLHGSRCRIDSAFLQITRPQQMHATLYTPPPMLCLVISHFCCVVFSSFTLNHLSPHVNQSQNREASTISGPGSGVILGRQDQAAVQELKPPHPDLPPPLPPLSPPPHLPPLPAGQEQDTAASSKNHQGKIGKGELSQKA